MSGPATIGAAILGGYVLGWLFNNPLAAIPGCVLGGLFGWWLDRRAARADD